MTIMSETTHIGFLGDESGSMSSNQAAMVDSFNEFVANVRKDTDGKDVRLTLGFFDLGRDHEILRIKIDSDLSEAREITTEDYSPWGSTPLNDATVRMIKHMEKTGADKRLLVIFTDGYENASETSTEDVRKLIAEKEQQGWEFIYLGANQDAWAEGQSRGVAQTSSYNFDATRAGTSSAMAATTQLAASRVNLSHSDYIATKDKMHADLGGKIDESDVSSQSVSDEAADKAKSLISGS